MAACPFTHQFPTRCFQFHGKTHRVLLQNERFQSCLIALVNALILKGELSLSGVPSSPVTVASSSSRVSDSVSLEDVVTLLQNYLLDKQDTSPGKDAPDEGNQDSNGATSHEDMAALLVNLTQTVEVHYDLSDVRSFKRKTPELGVLDQFNLKVMHGMKVSQEEDAALHDEISNSSFQELCEIVQQERLADVRREEAVNATGEAKVESSDCTTHISTKPLFKNWWHKHRGELTFDGISDLHKSLAPGEIVVFHRRGHFSVLTKQNAALFTLVTDLGVVEAMPHSPWETLADVEGCETDYANEIFFVHDEAAPSPQRFQQPVADTFGVFAAGDEEEGSPPPPPRRNSQLVKRGESGATAHTTIMLNKEVISNRELRRLSLQATPESSPQRQPAAGATADDGEQATTLDLGRSSQQQQAVPTTTAAGSEKQAKSSCCVVM